MANNFFFTCFSSFPNLCHFFFGEKNRDAKIAALERTSHESEKLIAEARNERLKHMDEIHIANKKCAELESQLKDLNFKLAEKETIINVLQKHSNDRDAVLQKTLRFTTTAAANNNNNNVTVASARHSKSASSMGLVVGTGTGTSNSSSIISSNNNGSNLINNNVNNSGNNQIMKINNLDEQIKEIESSQLTNKVCVCD